MHEDDLRFFRKERRRDPDLQSKYLMWDRGDENILSISGLKSKYTRKEEWVLFYKRKEGRCMGEWPFTCKSVHVLGFGI